MNKTKLLALSLCSICLIASAQTPAYLSISNDSPTSVQLNWTNQVGTTYTVLSTSDLTTPLSLWTPLEDAFSGDATVSASISAMDTPYGFFDVEIPTNSGVQIYSPTNGQTVSGTIAIGVGAQIGTQIQGVNLYLDDAQVGFIDSGGISFNLDTTHFTNGLHTVYVSAMDTGNGTTTTTPIALDFENPVRWLDADSLFQSFVPIDVESDIYPADWAVFVSDTNGTIVRAFSGSTSDGNINTNWDGNDNYGNYLPDEAIYNVSVVVTSSGSGNAMMQSSSLARNSTPSVVSARPNRHGVMEYEIAESVPNPMVTYSNMLKTYSQLPDNEKIIFPPFEYLTNESSAPMIKKISVRDMYMLQHPISNSGNSGLRAQGISANASSNGSGGSTSATLWRETAWNSGEIVLAQQHILGITGIMWNGTVGNLMNNVKNLVSLAESEVSGNRSVYQGSTLVMQQNGDFDMVKTALASSNPNTREFYFWGHGAINGNAIGFREGTPNDGITVTDLKNLLRNFYLPQVGNSSQKIITHKPFDLVFLDGCMTGVGSMPEAFGIPKAALNYTSNNKHKRAFMGWGGTISLSILDTESLKWSLAFWNALLSDPTGTTVMQAQAAAFLQHPSAGNGAPMETYGDPSLTWSN